tara:strand:+ start:1713 stop:1892 length:180 start_codon:yes stop_codon:yes gene_type:complete
MGERIFQLAMVGLVLYFTASQICALYFWYVFAQDHEFIATLFIGPFVAEFKGLLWPFFI